MQSGSINKEMMRMKMNRRRASRKRNRKSTSAAAEAFQNYMTERKEENSKMCDMFKRMHEDKNKMFGSFLEVFKMLTEKCI